MVLHSSKTFNCSKSTVETLEKIVKHLKLVLKTLERHLIVGTYVGLVFKIFAKRSGLGFSH